MELFEINNKYGSLIFKDDTEAKNILLQNGFKIITPWLAKKTYLEIVKDLETANKLHLFSPYSPNPDKELKSIYDQFEKIVLKESRGNGGYISKSWETLNSYLDYRSGCFYKWFK